MSASGAVTDTISYDAYGNLLAHNGVNAVEYLYAAMQYDAAIGQYYDHARYYDASSGRFTSRDSYDGQTNDPITENHYLYANADPIDRIDPNGLASLGEEVGDIGIMGQLQTLQLQAVNFAGAVAARNAAAFAAGSAALGRYLNDIGVGAQAFALRVINLFPSLAGNIQAEVQTVQSAGATTSSRMDYVITLGTKILQLEVKYNIPDKLGGAFTRLSNQIINMVNSTGQAVVWSLNKPSAADVERVRNAVGPINSRRVDFVHGIFGLYQYLKTFFQL